MNAEQKQRAMQMLRRFSQANPRTLHADNAAVDMAALLHELIDAPEAEPVAKTTGYYVGHLTISTVDGRVLPAGTALYLAPPAPSVPDVWRGLTDVEWMNIVNFDRAYSSYDKEGAVNEAVKRTEAKLKELNAAQQPEPPSNLEPSKEQLTQLLNGLGRCFVQGSKREFLRVWIRDWTLHKLPPADLVRDAERWRMLPAFLEEFEISYLRLEDAIDAAIEREKMKGGEA